MPNHCLNHLTVNGPVEDVAAFVKATEGQKSLVDAFVPMPKELEGTTAPFRGTPEEAAELRAKFGGFTDWYEWQNANWGVKWGDYDTDLLGYSDGSDFAVFTYTTPWGPMDRAILSISEKFPTLTFEVMFEEPGNALLGVTVDKNGERVGESYADPETFPELVENEDGYFDWDAYEEAMSDLRDQVLSDVKAVK